ncbi:FeoA domain-containing protein [Thermococcus sp. 9N3]|uniref:metal-dependent transcriptional regulator n=1 Tax=Thermococcus sp. 9N3 TaxID=163002 RepID=UPI00143223A2|nr:FeoA domain-containing protein [Thermococcus sp. 9N3]NJE48223.1 iron transporter FeoA [Thermococcus sp. 9N3]
MKWIEILMEDILRLAKEKGSPPTVEDIVVDSGVTKEEVREAVKELEKKGLAKAEGDRIILTREGERAAEVIYNYHRTVEKLFGHSTAHSLEHMGDRISYLEKAGRAKPLTEFKEGTEGVMVFMDIENPKVIARLMGVGLIPGTRFRVVRSGNVYVLETGGRVVVIDRNVAEKIKGVITDEGSPRGPA